MRVGNEDAGPVERVDEPVGDGVRPVRGRRECSADGATRELQVGQDGLDVGLWRGRRDACTADFRHCRDLRQVMRFAKGGWVGKRRRTTKNVLTSWTVIPLQRYSSARAELQVARNALLPE